MRIVFLGSDAIALPTLEFLRGAAGVELVGVVSQPDRPSGRGRHLHSNPVAAWARELSVALRQPEKPGPAETEWLRTERVDLVLVMAYGHLLRREFLDTPPLGAWNLHASLLPAYRGASPVDAAIACGDTQTGVCLMRMVEALDAGPVAGVETVSIRADVDAPALRARIAEACVPLLKRMLPVLAGGKVPVEVQDETRASYTRKLTKEDAMLNLAESAVVLERRIRALKPWPGSDIVHAGQMIKIGAAKVIEGKRSEAPGTVVGACGEGLDIATGDGVLRLLSLQRPGGKMLCAADFLRGYKIEVGEQLKSFGMKPLVSEKPFAKSGKK